MFYPAMFRSGLGYIVSGTLQHATKKERKNIDDDDH